MTDIKGILFSSSNLSTNEYYIFTFKNNNSTDKTIYCHCLKFEEINKKNILFSSSNINKIEDDTNLYASEKVICLITLNQDFTRQKELLNHIKSFISQYGFDQHFASTTFTKDIDQIIRGYLKNFKHDEVK